MKMLLDHHMKKQGFLLWGVLENEGWLALLEIPMLTFADVGLPIESNDRDVWRFVQKNRLILLTGNRNNARVFAKSLKNRRLLRKVRSQRHMNLETFFI